MTIKLPADVRKIIEILEAHGHSAYAVGGCVRDSLLLREPNDWDITTSASPEEVKAVFRRTVDTGIEHGTVTVLINRTGYEATTYRIDGAYHDGRHPESVTFTPELREDLRRRDFTINAMAYNDRDGLVDLFGGVDDLSKGIIRAVGAPEERFSEDALRIMRCIRFSAQLGFEIEPETYRAAEKLAVNLRQISRERVREELLKTLVSKHPEHVSLFERIGALSDFYPEFSQAENERVGLLQAVAPETALRLAAFFRKETVFEACGAIETGVKPDFPGDARTPLKHKDEAIADRVMNELRFDNETRKRVLALIRFSHEGMEPVKPKLRELLWRYGAEDFEDLMEFYEAANHCRKDAERALVMEILRDGDCISLKTLAVKGEDLRVAGVAPGREMGYILGELLATVLADAEMNERTRLLGEVPKIRERYCKEVQKMIK